MLTAERHGRTATLAVPHVRTATAALGLACLLAVAAQIRIPLPFTPVPITLQTFVLYLGGAWLGSIGALGGVLLYVAAALAGLPVMSGLRGGPEAFVGATGGYIVGWLIAVWLLGRLLGPDRTTGWRAVGAMLLASATILACGSLHLALLLELSIGQALLMGVVPFLPGDLLKVLGAAALVRRTADPLSLR